MLSSVEKSGIRDILNDLFDVDLFSLASTITKGFIKTNNREDAVQSIISCIEKPSDVLRRQRVTKKVLFSYLLKIKPTVLPDLSKAELILLCLEEWKSNEKCKVKDCVESPEEKTVNTSSWLPEFGVKFCEWYFPLLNELNDFGPEHFWSDCTLVGELKIASEKREAVVTGANEVTSFLHSLVFYDKYYFDANTSHDSVVTEQEQHGMVKITLGGVVHQFSNCIGLFDVAFGLVRNPAYNDNWKIKCMQIKIHVTGKPKQIEMNVNCYPSICQQALTNC